LEIKSRVIKKERIRVLHVFNEIQYSGAEIMYFTAAPLFQSDGIEMVALNSGKELGEFAPQFESLDIKVYHLPIANGTKNPIQIIKYFKSIDRLLRTEEIDVVHIHRSTYFLFFAIVGFLQGKTVLRTVHNVFKSRKLTWFKGFLDRFVARVFFNVVFQSIGDSVYFNEKNYYKNPTVKINNWYNNKKFYPVSSKEEKQLLRLNQNIPIDTFVIISTGSCTCVKNHQDVLEALAIVNRQYKCHYLHLGKGETLKDEMALCHALGLDNNVSFLGNQINVRDFLVASDAYVMPSLFEGLSIAAIEAMACSLPSVLYKSPGLVDLISQDDNGFLIDRSPNEMASKIISLIENPLVVEKMGYNARAFAENEFSVDKGVEKIINIYRS
jgi:glycosyltransferase involved in cell wall biosynthesis